MPSKDQAVRDAALKLHDAVMSAREAGMYVEWPNRVEGLPFIAVSETGKAAVTVQVATPASVSPEVTAKAGTAAQKAADKVIEKAADKPADKE